jgi:hypothetical protein
MTDIIDIFLDPDNVEHMSRVFPGARCGVRAYMHEFIYGPYGGGLYDLWTGTDADLYIRQMNDEFIRFMEARHNMRVRARGCVKGRAPVSARVETASYLDPYERAREAAKRAETMVARRASGRALAREFARAPVPSPSAALYARTNRDRAGAMHLVARDDEGAGAGVPSRVQSIQSRFGGADPDATERDWGRAHEWWRDQVQCGDVGVSGATLDSRDPTAGTGEAQHHLLVLDAQMAVLNDEKTLPYGYGSAQEQLADDARVAWRHRAHAPERGVIPKTSYKKLVRVQAPGGRVTLDDDRELARDIFSRDSKGFILSGRR